MTDNCNRGSRKGFMQHHISEAPGFGPQGRFLCVLFLFLAIHFSLFVMAGTSFAETYVSGNITSNTTWGVAGSPYIVTGDVTVRHTTASTGGTVAVLTIEPGVVVRFAPGTGMYIGQDRAYSDYDYYGALSAQGTTDEPVVFTSNAPSPAPGDWKGIYFRNFTNDSQSLIEHVIVEYGGNSHSANIYCASASPTVKNSTIRYSSAHGIYVDGGSSPLISGNFFTGNNDSPINVHALRVYRLSGNSGTGNGKDYIEVRGAVITANAFWSKQDLPYVIIGDVTVRHTTASTGGTVAVLTIESGVVVRFASGTGMYIGQDRANSDYDYYGALSAQGTTDEPVVFTSNAPSPAPGDWKGVTFTNFTGDAASVLRNCMFEYGGSTSEKKRNIYCGGANPTITNCTIRYSSGAGIYLESSSPTIESNLITDNGQDGIFGDGGSSPTVRDNVLNNNGGVAVYVRPNYVNRITENTGSGNGEDVIKISGGEINTSGTWIKQDLPFVVDGDVTVRHTTASTGGTVAVLTIEPGVVVRFAPGTGMYIGQDRAYSDYDYYGALSAQGTTDEPVVFTSNAPSPAPGDWKGIYFRNFTNDSQSLIEHVIVEYGGNSHSANIYCASASPTVKNNTIRYSSAHGIYVDGGSSPLISGNFFTGNNDSPINVHALRVYRLSGNSGTGNGKDYIEVRGAVITANAFWSKQDLPYVIIGDVTVRHTTASTGGTVAVLTIESGVVVRFASGTGMYIGQDRANSDYDYYGALSAQGTTDEPVVFTSNAPSPAPGDWKGIYFRNFTNDSQSLLEHCIIEFAGHTNNANIYLNNAKPTLQYNTIRNSSHSGIYVNGTGSNGAAINCNNMKDNHYGVYTINDARPVITGNNFLRNLNAGVYNTSGVTVVAENNWWNDPNGANFNGDDASGIVDFTPWLMAASDCITTPPTNTPPFAPKNPNPANGAVRVPAIDGIVTVSWLGGDPNPWDTVTYDVYFGNAADNLVIIYTDTDVTSAQMSGLLTGTTYYWQVVARDNTGAETQGPIWHFTTDGPPSDLVVGDVTWAPAENLAAGQTITFTAAITNTGTGPVVDAFQVAFKIDGVSIGSASAGSILQVGESVQVTRTWTAKAGDHTLEVTADSGGKVSESDESNNTLFRTLPTIIDPTPPVMTGSVPADGAFVQTVNQIRFTLVDQYGVVDDAAVSASVTVLGGGQLLSGTVLESNDQFTFVPATAPLPDGVYQVALTAADVSGNTQVYSFAFTVDQQPPAAPAITGGTVVTGVIRVRPFDNRSNTAVITLTGNRDADTSVWVDNIRKVDVGSGDWSVTLNLPQGVSALEIWVQDTAANRSESVWVDMLIDSVAPSITSITPENNSFLNVPPNMVVVGFTEATTILNLDDSTRALRDAGLNVVPGSWSVAVGNQLVFTPSAPLPESTYIVELQLEDELGNRGAAVQYRFAVDTTKPPTPAIDPVTSPTHNPSQIIGGSKEEYAAILLDGQQIIGNTGDTTWQHTVALTNGINNFAFAAKDRAGNQSEAVNVGILFDDVAPDPVTTLTVNGEGDGRTVYLDWSGYNEAVHGDIASYRVVRRVGTLYRCDRADGIRHGCCRTFHRHC